MTYEDLVKLGAKPVDTPAPAPVAAVPSGGGMTLEQLTAMGAKPVDESKPAPAEKPSFLSEVGSRIAAPFKGARDIIANATMPTSLSDAWARIKQNAPEVGNALIAPVRTLGEASGAVTDELAHPKRMLQGAPLARALGYSTPEAVAHADAANREFSRGVVSAVPFAGLARERLTGFPESSPADAALAPGASAFGAVTAAPFVAKIAPEAKSTVLNAAQDATEGATNAVRGIGEKAIERSEERLANSSTPVKDAISEAATTIKKNAEKTATHAILAELGARIPGVGHSLTGLALAKDVGIPLAKAAGVAADEGLAAFARRALGDQGIPVAETSPFTSDQWRPRLTGPLPPSWKPRAGAGAPIEPIAAPSEVPAEPPISDNPQIAAYQDALRGATPEQTKEYTLAIKQIEDRLARAKTRPAPGPMTMPPEPVPPLPERMAPPQTPDLAPATPAEPPAPIAHPPPAMSSVLSEAPTWKPSAKDERFARQLGMKVADYRNLMAKRTAMQMVGRLPAPVGQPPAGSLEATLAALGQQP